MPRNAFTVNPQPEMPNIPGALESGLRMKGIAQENAFRQMRNEEATRQNAMKPQLEQKALEQEKAKKLLEKWSPIAFELQRQYLALEEKNGGDRTAAIQEMQPVWEPWRAKAVADGLDASEAYDPVEAASFMQQAQQLGLHRLETSKDIADTREKGLTERSKKHEEGLINREKMKQEWINKHGKGGSTTSWVQIFEHFKKLKNSSGQLNTDKEATQEADRRILKAKESTKPQYVALRLKDVISSKPEVRQRYIAEAEAEYDMIYGAIQGGATPAAAVSSPARTPSQQKAFKTLRENPNNKKKSDDQLWTGIDQKGIK